MRIGLTYNLKPAGAAGDEYEEFDSLETIESLERALRACGHEPVRIRSGGASDANVLVAAGLETVNVANGTEKNHEPGERVSVAALEEMLEVALALLEEAAEAIGDGAR